MSDTVVGGLRRQLPASDRERAESAYRASLAFVPGAEPIQLIAPDGTRASGRDGGLELPDPDTLLDAYRKMVLARRWDKQTTALSRQGRLATYPSAQGQEAGEIGAVVALAETDWLFPTYRDSIALLTRGVPATEILPFFRGDWHIAYNPHDYHVSNQTTPLATQALHAVGFGHAARLKGESTVTLTFIGDGATSEGDAHEAMNFAAVWSAPTIFFVQNNRYAISVPYDRQARARTLADRGIGYGIPGVWVDGNDAAAVIAAVRAAAARARAGEGPTLIETDTYRTESHTNSDDPTRYRTRDEEAAWAHLDPIARLQAYLSERGLIDEASETALAAEAEALAASAREAMTIEPDLDPLEIFDHVYAIPRPALAEQRAALATELANREEER